MNTILEVYVKTYHTEVVSLENISSLQTLFKSNMLLTLNDIFDINNKDTLIKLSDEISTIILLIMKTFLVYYNINNVDEQCDYFMTYYGFFLTSLQHNFKNSLNSMDRYVDLKRLQVNKVLEKLYRQLNICMVLLSTHSYGRVF